MGVFSRLSDIINSNINSMLDRAEDPEKIVRLIIQEMEDTLIELKSSCAGIIAERKKIERELNEAEAALEHQPHSGAIPGARHLSDNNRMITPVVHRGLAAFKPGKTASQMHRAMSVRLPAYLVKIITGAGEMRGQRLLILAHHVDGIGQSGGKYGMARRSLGRTPQHQRWGQRHRGKGIGGDRLRSVFGLGCDNRNARAKAAQRMAIGTYRFGAGYQILFGHEVARLVT